MASFFASGLGGGVVVAGIVIAAGASLVAAAFVGGARWLVLPALAVALPLAFVSAAGIDLDGGFGERRERPATVAELAQTYRLGAGELVVDLRELDLPAGDHPLHVRIGTGHALVLVPEDVCVATSADIGMGAVQVFNHESGGIDVDWTGRAPRPRRRRPGSCSRGTSVSASSRCATTRSTIATAAGRRGSAAATASPPRPPTSATPPARPQADAPGGRDRSTACRSSRASCYPVRRRAAAGPQRHAAPDLRDDGPAWRAPPSGRSCSPPA